MHKLTLSANTFCEDNLPVKDTCPLAVPRMGDLNPYNYRALL